MNHGSQGGSSIVAVSGALSHKKNGTSHLEKHQPHFELRNPAHPGFLRNAHVCPPGAFSNLKVGDKLNITGPLGTEMLLPPDLHNTIPGCVDDLFSHFPLVHPLEIGNLYKSIVFFAPESQSLPGI